MSNWMVAVGALALAAGSAAHAQDYVHWAAPRTNASGQSYHFPMGTPVTLVTRTQLNTKDNKAGDRVYLEVAESLSFRGQVIVPIGSMAVGEVSRVQRNGHFGKKGKLEVRLLYVQTPSGPIRLTGRSYDEGKSGTAASVATMALFSGLGFLIHGTSGYIEPGTPVRAYFAEPMLFTMNQSQPNDAAASATPDTARALPARFDPSVFGGNGPNTSTR